MAVWLWIYIYNDFALCNWSTAQPSKKKDCVNNLSFLKVVGLVFFPFCFSVAIIQCKFIP